MKHISAVLCIVLVVATSCFGAYDKNVVHVLEQLRECKLAFSEELPMVGGAAIGDGARPHEFHLLFPYVMRFASDVDLEAMLQDPSPVVRIMGVKCILSKKALPERLKLAAYALDKDQTRVYVAAGGCIIDIETVSKVVADLRKDPNYL